jgi:hypothetical protein
VENLTEKEILERGVRNWPDLEKDAYGVGWQYNSIQDCLMLEDETLVETADGKVEFSKSNLTNSTKRIPYTWNIKEYIKRYRRVSKDAKTY